jgi:hypothetical protein
MVAAPPATPGIRTRRAAAAEQAAAAKAPPAAPAAAPTPPAPLLRFLARCVLLAWLAAVWLWHLTPRARLLPGASGYFWFCRYLTFYSFSLQLLATAAQVAHEGGGHWRRRRRQHQHQGRMEQARPRVGDRAPGHNSSLARAAAVADAADAEVERVGRAAAAAGKQAASALARWADDLGCAVFCFAHVVTLMFHIIQRATGGKAVEGAHLDRPPWLDASVHRLNSLAVWVDVALLSERGARSFSRSGERLSIFLVALYCAVLASSKWLNGAFPYPFMNAMRQPSGFLIVCGGGMVIFGAAFRVGRAVGRGLRAAEDYFSEDAAAVAVQQQQQQEAPVAKEVVEKEAPPGRGKRGKGKAGGGNPLGRAWRFLLRRPSAEKKTNQK